MGTLMGLASFGIMLAMVAGLLRQLGAGEAAKGLLIVAGVLFFGMAFLTYLPHLMSAL
ncbi:MAG: hypothetical protein AAF224_05600 [Pseudomonadota bacterium]